MAYILNWNSLDSKISSVKINNVSVSTGVELHDGDTITFTCSIDEIQINGTTYYPTDNIIITDSNIIIATGGDLND